jgi:hypothetical protein
MNQRPKLSIKLELEGPKVAVPVPTSEHEGALAWIPCSPPPPTPLELSAKACCRVYAMTVQRVGKCMVVPLLSTPCMWSCAGGLTLFLDLGSFSVETDTGLLAQLVQEEAALYECLRLRSRDISAYVVDGEFSFHDLERDGASGQPEVMSSS